MAEFQSKYTLEGVRAMLRPRQTRAKKPVKAKSMRLESPVKTHKEAKIKQIREYFVPGQGWIGFNYHFGIDGIEADEKMIQSLMKTGVDLIGLKLEHEEVGEILTRLPIGNLMFE